jgi:hypothetical protein
MMLKIQKYISHQTTVDTLIPVQDIREINSLDVGCALYLKDGSVLFIKDDFKTIETKLGVI